MGRTITPSRAITPPTSEDVLADDTDSLSCEGSVCLLKTEVVNAHCAGCPYHCDEALKDHHVVEGVASLTLALHCAGDDSGLGGVEAGEYAAGDGHEEYRQEVAVCEVLAVVEYAVVAPDAVPNVEERIALDEQADENAHCGEQKDSAEDGVDAAYDFVDGEYGGAQVVQEDNAVNDPCRDRVGCAGEVKYLSCGNVAGV